MASEPILPLRPASPNRCFRGAKGDKARGLTLVELLITITIIGLLGVGSAAVYHKARDSANRANTRALIMKINQIIMTKYGSYQGRRVRLNGSVPVGTPKLAAIARVNAMRELVQMEMPDRFWELPRGTDPTPPPMYQTPQFMDRVPALAERYRRIYNVALKKMGNDHDRLIEHSAAECLYMVVMSIPEAAEQFTAKDFGDIDQDGLPEFHDAWGQPVRWIRWPAGFVPGNQADTDLQTGVIYDPTIPESQPDPFDPRGLLVIQGEFPLFPLIFSAGPDREYDIYPGNDSGDLIRPYRVRDGNIDPFAKPTDAFGTEQEFIIGLPRNPTESMPSVNLRHTDNIHNHRIETR